MDLHQDGEILTTRPGMPAIPVGFSGPDVSRSRLAGKGDDKPMSFLLRKDGLTYGVNTKTCPQCGLNPGGLPKKRVFLYVPPWVYLGFLANIIVVLVLYSVGRKRVETRVTLCDDCARADRRGRTLRGFSVVGVIAGILAPLFVGLAVDSPEVAIFGMGVGLVAGIVGAVVTHRRTQGDVILCLHIDAQQVKLKASPAWRRVLAEEQPDLLLG